jgi:prepilin-type N-terminal cleavage/methylation domain-containing protein
MTPSLTFSQTLRRSRRVHGFTLIEILLGLALIGMLAGGIFAVQRGALSVSAEVVERETKTLKVHSFCELLRRNFEQMPGNARVNLQFWGGAGSDLTEVAFSDYPLAFSWPGVQAGAKTVIFRTERSVGLGLQAAILYLDAEQADAWTKDSMDEDKILGRLTIMDGISWLGWRFFNETTQEWETEWPLTNTRRPTFVEMTLQFMDGDDPVSLVFWIPTMVNPQQFTGFAGAPGQGGIPQQPGGGPEGQPGGGPPGSGMSVGRPPGGGRGDGGRGGGRGDGGRGGGGRGDGGRGGGGRPQGGGRGR